MPDGGVSRKMKNHSKSILKRCISMMCIFHKVIISTIDCHGMPTSNLVTET